MSFLAPLLLPVASGILSSGLTTVLTSSAASSRIGTPTKVGTVVGPDEVTAPVGTAQRRGAVALRSRKRRPAILTGGGGAGGAQAQQSTLLGSN